MYKMKLDRNSKIQDMNKVVSCAIIAWITTFCVAYSLLNMNSSVTFVPETSLNNMYGLLYNVKLLDFNFIKIG